MTAPEDLKAWRRAQRETLLTRRLAIAPGDYRAGVDAITGHLIAAFSGISTLMTGFTWPFKQEPDARYFARHLRDRGGRTALPDVAAWGQPLVFREWHPGVPMEARVYDIPVPVGTPVVLPGALLMPPVGFDACGYRLGYGGGFFDRTIAALPQPPVKIGVAFDCSRIPTIHPQSWDIPMDYVVTETGIWRAGGKPLERIEAAVAADELAGRIAALARKEAS